MNVTQSVTCTERLPHGGGGNTLYYGVYDRLGSRKAKLEVTAGSDLCKRTV